MDFEWISVGMSISSIIDRFHSMLFIRHFVFSIYFKFRVNSEKNVNSIFQSDTGASIDDFNGPRVGISGDLDCFEHISISLNGIHPTLRVLKIFEIPYIQKKPSIRYFRVTQLSL